MADPATIVERHQIGYPRRLYSVRDAPDTMWVRGVLSECHPDRAVAVVGARAARQCDVVRARAIARDLASTGALVISGGALGVDAASHRGALESGRRGATLAVLGCGVEVDYPSQNRVLFAAICAAGGAVVSQFAPDAPPRAWHFVKRNRTMAGMADAVLVVAASSRSGSLHTARAARQLGRVVAAVPGTPGCEALIASGAAPVSCADDLLDALSGRPKTPDVAMPKPDSEAEKVLRCLDQVRGYHPDQLASATGLSIRQVSRALTSLELDGLAVLLPGRNYVRSKLAQTLLAR